MHDGDVTFLDAEHSCNCPLPLLRPIGVLHPVSVLRPVGVEVGIYRSSGLVLFDVKIINIDASKHVLICVRKNA